MVGTPQLQMLAGLLIGAPFGAMLGWPLHPLFGIVGFFLGAIAGVLYAGLGCLVCGTTLDHFANVIRSRRYALGSFSFVVWLAVSAVVVAAPFVIVIAVLSRR